MKSPDIETAIRLYYAKPELTGADIKELFDVAPSTITLLKKQVLKEMAKSQVKAWLPRSVNTKIAYNVWGIDIEDFEERLKKLRTLNLGGNRNG